MYELGIATRQGIFLNEAISCVLIITSPLFLLFYWIAYQNFSSSLISATTALIADGPSDFFLPRIPPLTRTAVLSYGFWVALQAFLYVFLPGPTHVGPRTPGGRRLEYKLNGLRVWALTIGAAVAICYYGLIDPAFIASHWGELLAVASTYSIVVVVIFQVKARFVPDNAGDTLITGHFWYDLFNGGELHPRLGRLFDCKHFNASRTGGMITWTLIDLSFAAWQYQTHGFLTNSMILAVGFRFVIVAEYFWIEHWFFETLDGGHERFAFYNIYGFAAMMPQLWTLQTQYLAQNPVILSRTQCTVTSLAFLMGWGLGRLVNIQKVLARVTNGQCMIWGTKARCIEATYHTADGKTHRTQLLCSGWWGVARHANYIGTALYTWASCVTCGTDSLFPYAEAVLVTGIVIHRCFRDEARCKQKYGVAWEEYCRAVPWRMIPGIF